MQMLSWHCRLYFVSGSCCIDGNLHGGILVTHSLPVQPVDVTTSQDLELRAKETDLKIELVRRDIKDLELKIMTQLSTMQQDIQMTKITNRALLAICSISAGVLIKIAFF